MQRPTVFELLQLKGRRQLLQIHVDDAFEAEAAEASGIDIITCEVDLLPAVRGAAPGTFIQASGPFDWIAGREEGVRRGFEAMKAGADAIYFAGGLGIVEAMAREGIPVTGHVGLVPRHATWTTYRAVGKEPEEAVGLLKVVKALERAGAWAVEVEVVPARIAAHLTQSTQLLTEGMGSGASCDTQYLFSCDVLGTNAGRMPRHSKAYANLRAELAKLQGLRVEAFRAFRRDVGSGAFPESRHSIDVDDATFERFLDLAGRERGEA